MTPRDGGPALPVAPLVLPGPAARAVARRYVRVLETALDNDAQEWSPGQRRYLRARLGVWRLRAAGMDAQYEQYGTFPRCPGTEKPTTTDLVVAGWRARFQASLTPEEKARRRAASRRERRARQ